MAKKNSSNGSGSSVGFIIGIVLIIFGLFVSPIVWIIGIVLVVQNRRAVQTKKEETAPRGSAPQKPPVTVGRPSQPPRPAPSAPSQPRQAVPRPVTSARPDPGRPTPRQSSSASYDSYAQDHYHITGTGLSKEKRLEQLEVMKNAGLIDKEEYQVRRREISRER